MNEFFKDYIKKQLEENGVDIYSKYYKSSGNYQKVKGERVFGGLGRSISLEEFIERYLLTEKKTNETYESIYDMGNPYQLNDTECENEAVAKEIIDILGLSGDNILENTLRTFKRGDGRGCIIKGLQDNLNLDLEAFESKDQRYKREKCKILYFFYMLQNIIFPHTHTLQLLGKPSMENTDNLFLNIDTANGSIIKYIKDSLEKELSLCIKDRIKKRLTPL